MDAEGVLPVPLPLLVGRCDGCSARTGRTVGTGVASERWPEVGVELDEVEEELKPNTFMAPKTLFLAETSDEPALMLELAAKLETACTGSLYEVIIAV